MKKTIYVLIVSLILVSGLVFANRELKGEDYANPSPKSLTDTEKKAENKKWEESPEGIRFKKWEESPEGKKVFAGITNISKNIREYTNMEAVVTSLSLPQGSLLGFGVMVRINGDDYILRFDDELQHLRSLKVNDKIIIKSHGVSYAPKYAYPIISGEYAERDGKIIYIHPPRKGGC